MSSRELTYRINLSTNDAKRQARNVRATFEAELRTIQVGKLDVSQIQAAVSQAQRLRVEFEQAAVAANRVSQNASNIRPPAVAPTAPPPAASGGIGAGIGGAIVGGVAGYLTIQGLQLVSNYVVESAKLDTQIRRTEAAFEFLASGAAQAEARILALQQASNGTITRLDAMTSSNQIAALGLASTTQEFEELAKAAKIVSTYSSQIHDFNDALVQLGLFSNSSGYQRADQLLIDSGDPCAHAFQAGIADCHCFLGRRATGAAAGYSRGARGQGCQGGGAAGKAQKGAARQSSGKSGAASHLGSPSVPLRMSTK